MVKRYLITTAQAGATPHRHFLEGLQTYAAKNDAELVILPTAGKTVTDDVIHDDLLPYVRDDNFAINNNLRVSNYQIRPQQINPLTGIKRFAPGDKSFIFAGTKQVLEYVSNSNDTFPKAVMTTGAVTQPNYRMHMRIGRIAEKDHEYGAVVVEVESPTLYHFRHIKALANGKFTDLLGSYDGKKVKTDKRALAFVVGDLHPYDTDPKHEALTMEQLAFFDPKHVFLHDTFNGKSISHHYDKHYIQQYMVAMAQGLDLGKELEHTAKAVKKYAAATRGRVHIVASNHDEHLFRYLDEGRFVGDKGNDLIGARLYQAALEGHNPLQVGLGMYGLVEDNVDFLKRDEDYMLKGFQLGNHGDLGSNGSRGGPRAIEEANAKSITGHGHSAFKIRNTYRVGTSTRYRLGYNRGPSNWTQSNAVLYENGTVQLLNTVKGVWKHND